MGCEGTAWSSQYDDGVVVGRFYEDMPIEAFEEEAYPAFEEIVGRYRDDIVGTADLIENDSPYRTNSKYQTPRSTPSKTSRRQSSGLVTTERCNRQATRANQRCGGFFEEHFGIWASKVLRPKSYFGKYVVFLVST